jgi:hypothetical protein
MKSIQQRPLHKRCLSGFWTGTMNATLNPIDVVADLQAALDSSVGLAVSPT